MPQKITSFERFRKELKKRKTDKVIIALASTDFFLHQHADVDLGIIDLSLNDV